MFVFSSFGFRSPTVRNKLKTILNPHEKNILIVPFAAFNVDHCVNNEKGGLVQFGFEEKNIFICEGQESFARSYDYIYVPGGETFKLLKILQEKDLLFLIKKLVDGGTDYIGVSAGAELATINLEYVRNLEDNNHAIDNFDGLALVNDVILPHSDQRYVLDKIHCMKDVDRQKRTLIEIPNDGVVLYTFEKGQTSIRFL